MPLLLAQLATDEASASVKVEPSSLTPIIGVIPMLEYEYEQRPEVRSRRSHEIDALLIPGYGTLKGLAGTAGT